MPSSPAVSTAPCDFSLHADDAVYSLERFSEQSGVQIVYLVEQVRGLRTAAVSGRMAPRVALERLLADTGLSITVDERSGAFIVKGVPRAETVASVADSSVGRKVPRRRTVLGAAAAWLGLLLSPGAEAPALAAPTVAAVAPADCGTVSGTVSNGATGAYLEGAQLVLEPGGAIAFSSRDGKFAFSGVTPGLYNLTATYTGLDAKTVPVTLGKGDTSNHDLSLTAEVYKLTKFVVEGEREGNALAITQQRNAPNVQNVISSDAFGDVADLNLANFLTRLPGFSTEMSEGEIMAVRIRGTAPGLSSVGVDGTRLANGTTRTFDRGADIDRISADFIETIEVSKGMTPDIDADSIGGAVNLKTKSAFDRKGRRITYDIGQNYNINQRTFRPKGNVSFSDVFADGKLGVLFTASYNESHRPRDYITFDWERTTDTARPAWFNTNSYGLDQIKHRRAGASFRFDYRLSATTRLNFNTAFSSYADQLNRRWIRLSTPSNANVVEIADDYVVTKNQTFTWHQTFRDRTVNTANFTLGGESRIIGGKLDFSTNFSRSYGAEHDPDRFALQRTISGVSFRQTRVGHNDGIQLTQLSGPDVTDWRNSQLNIIDIPDTVSEDEILGAQLNFTRPIAFVTPLTLKTGLRYRHQERDRDNFRRYFKYVGPNGIVGPVGANNDDDLGRFWEKDYSYHPNRSLPPDAGMDTRYIDMRAVRKAITDTPQYFQEDYAVGTRDSIINDNQVSESVSAAYFSLETRLGKLRVLGGVRVEDTRVTGDGFKQEITAEEKSRRAAWVGAVTSAETIRRTLAEYANPVSARGHYCDLFPSLHLSYQLTPNLLARASYSTGIGRPSFGQIIPTISINNDNDTITANNPDLRPQYSDNFDVTLEYYFKPAGQFSVAGFEKRISDFIYRQSGGYLASGNPYGEEYNGYLLTTDYNGGSARIRGLEVSYQQQFTHLPGFWRGFGVFSNFTWLETKGDYGTPGSVITQKKLANFTPRSGNLGVSYSLNHWNVRVMANHTGERLMGYNEDPTLCRYQFETTPIDINVSYTFDRRLRFYVDIIDVFNVGRQNEYRYMRERHSGTFIYSSILKFGVGGSF